MSTSNRNEHLEALAVNLINFGKSQGADEIEVTVMEGSEFSVDIRLAKIENLIEAGSRHVGLKIIKDQRTAFATSSDLSEETLQYLIKNCIKRTKLANADKFSGLPPDVKKPINISSLRIFDPSIIELPLDRKIDLARETEKIALKDTRITNSHGASFETRVVKTILANSCGFLHSYEESLCSLGLGLQAGDIDNKVEDFWSSSKRFLNELESPEEIAKAAIERTVRQLNPKKIRTQNVPVIFEPMMTAWLMGFMFVCVSGVSVYQGTSFLCDKLNNKIGNDQLTVIDDGLLAGKLGTSPYDSEGVPSQRTVISQEGILKNFLCNTYAARKLDLSTTGNADGNGVGPNNFYLEPGTIDPKKIISDTDKGLLLIRTIGHGLNPLTGDISRGAFGLWIEKGEIIYPVSEITISGNLGKIFHDIEEKANDLDFRSPVTGPTIKIREMTVAGD